MLIEQDEAGELSICFVIILTINMNKFLKPSSSIPLNFKIDPTSFLLSGAIFLFLNLLCPTYTYLIIIVQRYIRQLLNFLINS